MRVGVKPRLKKISGINKWVCYLPTERSKCATLVETGDSAKGAFMFWMYEYGEMFPHLIPHCKESVVLKNTSAPPVKIFWDKGENKQTLLERIVNWLK